MQYMFLIYSRETPEGPSIEEGQVAKEAHWAVMEAAREKGVLVAVNGLKPTVTATTVRVQGDQALITDGPFAETKEQLAGYYILECADLDEAIEWAKKIPTLCKGSSGCIEVRPVAQLPRR